MPRALGDLPIIPKPKPQAIVSRPHRPPLKRLKLRVATYWGWFFSQ